MHLKSILLTGLLVACSFFSPPSKAQTEKPDFKVEVIGHFPNWDRINQLWGPWVEEEYYRNWARWYNDSQDAGPAELFRYRTQQVALASATIALKVIQLSTCAKIMTGPRGSPKDDLSNVRIDIALVEVENPAYRDYDAVTLSDPETGLPIRILLLPPFFRYTKQQQAVVIAHEIGHWFGNDEASMHVGEGTGPTKTINGRQYQGRWSTNQRNPNFRTNTRVYNQAVNDSCRFGAS